MPPEAGVGGAVGEVTWVNGRSRQPGELGPSVRIVGGDIPGTDLKWQSVRVPFG